MALTNAQYETIIRGYEETQDANRYALEKRREEVYEKIPGFEELDGSAGASSLQALQAIFGDGEEPSEGEPLTALRIKLSAQRKKRAQMLSDAGFPSDYLDPIYTCPLCQDTGYIANPNGGKEKCSCFRRQELSLLYAQSNLQELLKTENFSTLSRDYYQGEDLQHFDAAVALCKNFVQNFKQDYRNLFFYGTVGTGKSFLSGCVAGELLKNGSSVIYFGAPNLFDTLARYAFDYKEKSALEGLYEDLFSCDLLIIDDLGTEVTNSFVTSRLFQLLNERALRKKSIIISTNLGLEDLRDRYSDRIFSRITTGFELCKLTGPDIRIIKKCQTKN